MRQTQTAFFLLLALTLAGCATMDARNQLAQAETTYAAALDTAIELREFGLIDDEASRQLSTWFIAANDLLARANEFITSGKLEEAERAIEAAKTLLESIAERLSDP